MDESVWAKVGLSEAEYERLERGGYDPSFELRAYPNAVPEQRAHLRLMRGTIRKFLDSPLGLQSRQP